MGITNSKLHVQLEKNTEFTRRWSRMWESSKAKPHDAFLQGNFRGVLGWINLFKPMLSKEWLSSYNFDIMCKIRNRQANVEWNGNKNVVSIINSN